MDQDQEAPCRQRAVCRRDTCQRRLQAASRPPTRSSACLQPASLCVFSLSVCLSAASLSVCLQASKPPVVMRERTKFVKRKVCTQYAHSMRSMALHCTHACARALTPQPALC